MYQIPRSSCQLQPQFNPPLLLHWLTNLSEQWTRLRSHWVSHTDSCCFKILNLVTMTTMPQWLMPHNAYSIHGWKCSQTGCDGTFRIYCLTWVLNMCLWKRQCAWKSFSFFPWCSHALRLEMRISIMPNVCLGSFTFIRLNISLNSCPAQTERFLCKLRNERGKSGVVQGRNYTGGVEYSYWLSIWGD